MTRETKMKKNCDKIYPKTEKTCEKIRNKIMSKNQNKEINPGDDKGLIDILKGKKFLFLRFVENLSLPERKKSCLPRGPFFARNSVGDMFPIIVLATIVRR